MHASLCLKHNPFIPIPPAHSYGREFGHLFCARNAEVERLCASAARPSAVFVVAPYGGGKTVVILEALSRLRRQGLLAIYAQFRRERGFRSSILDGAADYGVSTNETEPLTAIRKLIRKKKNAKRRVVLAIDDLDRAADIIEVFQVTDDVRDFISDGAAVVISGQPMGVTSDLHTSAGAIFHEIALPEFSEIDFSEMLKKYLKSAHTRLGLGDTHPFVEAAGLFVCREVARARLTPRLFNFLASELITLASAARISLITPEFVREHWPMLAERVVGSLTPLQVEHLRKIFEAGQVSEDTPDAINALGQDKFSEYHVVRDNILRPLVEKNLLLVRRVSGKEVFSLTGHSAWVMGKSFAHSASKPVPFKELESELALCHSQSDPAVKGQLLERFAEHFFNSIPGFRVPTNGRRLRTESEELDLTIEITGDWLHVSYGVLTICECKNWKQPVSWDQLTTLVEKLRARSCRFGIFIALKGVTDGFRKKLKGFLRDGLVIALLTETELN